MNMNPVVFMVAVAGMLAAYCLLLLGFWKTLKMVIVVAVRRDLGRKVEGMARIEGAVT